jgi:hypothetical protein
MSGYDNDPRVDVRGGGHVVTADGWEVRLAGGVWTAWHPRQGTFRERGAVAEYRSRDGLLRMVLRDFGVAS